jgi:hypothetical protein
MSSWRPLVAGSVGLFLVILAFLAGQLKGGGDPALGQSRSAATQPSAPTPQPDFGAPSGVEPDAEPPTTHQS